MNGLISALHRLFIPRRKFVEHGTITLHVLDNGRGKPEELNVEPSVFAKDSLSVGNKESVANHLLDIFLIRVHSEIRHALVGKPREHYLVLLADTVESGYTAFASGLVNYAVDDLLTNPYASAYDDGGGGKYKEYSGDCTVFISHLHAPGMFKNYPWCIEDKYAYNQDNPFRVFSPDEFNELCRRTKERSIHAE